MPQLLLHKAAESAAKKCVNKQNDSKEVATQVSVQRWPFGTQIEVVDAAHISIHSKFVPADENGHFDSRTGFDIAILELGNDETGPSLPLGHSFANLSEELRMNRTCGALVFREARRWKPMLILIKMQPSRSESGATAIAAFASMFSGSPAKSPSEFDTIEAVAASPLLAGDSGAPIICRDSSKKWSLVGLLRGGGQGRGSAQVVLQDIYFDSWLLNTRLSER